jgi:L-cysteate sulfo-lyase
MKRHVRSADEAAAAPGAGISRSDCDKGRNQNLSSADIRALVERIPRISLTHLPTPLEELSRLAATLGGPRVFVKRDDCTGLAFGGNKSRHLEFSLAAALAQGADCVVHSAAPQSNDARQLCAAAARLGLKAYLLPQRTFKTDIQGNLFLDHLLGADVRFIDPERDQEAEKRRFADELRALGRRPFVLETGAAAEAITIGYVLCAMELHEQCQSLQIDPGRIYICSRSGSQSGLVLGGKALGRCWQVYGVNASPGDLDERAMIAEIGNRVAHQLGLADRLSAEEILNTHEYAGTAYGAVTEASLEAIRLCARTEGLLLEPVYTAKAMAALIDHVRTGQMRCSDDPIIFVHTGGLPALFAYRDEIMQGLTESRP